MSLWTAHREVACERGAYRLFLLCGFVPDWPGGAGGAPSGRLAGGQELKAIDALSTGQAAGGLMTIAALWRVSVAFGAIAALAVLWMAFFVVLMGVVLCVQVCPAGWTHGPSQE
jgi:hypothetical protein